MLPDKIFQPLGLNVLMAACTRQHSGQLWKDIALRNPLPPCEAEAPGTTLPYLCDAPWLGAGYRTASGPGRRRKQARAIAPEIVGA